MGLGLGSSLSKTVQRHCDWSCDAGLLKAHNSLAIAGTAESLATADTASTFWGVGGWGANINASNVEVAPQLATTILWNQGRIGDSRMMWLVLLMRSMDVPPQLQASRSRSPMHHAAQLYLPGAAFKAVSEPFKRLARAPEHRRLPEHIVLAVLNDASKLDVA